MEHLAGVRKVIGSIPVGDSDFFFVLFLLHDDHIFCYIFYLLI